MDVSHQLITTEFILNSKLNLSLNSNLYSAPRSLARNLLRVLRTTGSPDSSGNHDDEDETPPPEDVLGRCYERQTRVRQLIERHPLRQREEGTYAIYTSLTCPELADHPQV